MSKQAHTVSSALEFVSKDKVIVTAAGLIGLTTGLKITLVGELYVVELLLIPFALLLLLLRGDAGALQNRYFLTFLLACAITVFGYVLSDLIVGTDFKQYSRGWARMVFLSSNIMAIVLLTLHSKRALFAFVLASALIVVAMNIGNHIAISHWKLHYAGPVTMLAMAMFLILPRRVAAVGLIAIGLMSMFLDSRIHGAIVLLTGILIFIKTGTVDKKKLPILITKYVLAGAIALTIVALVLDSTKADNQDRRDISNAGRAAAIHVAIDVIMASPIIGYGSWTENAAVASMLVKRLKSELDLRLQDQAGTYLDTGGKLFLPHSQILQAWQEGGVFGAALFLVLAVLTIITLVWHIFIRSYDVYSALFLYILLNGLWHLFASPFGGDTRLHIAILIAVVVLTSIERKQPVQEPSATKGAMEVDSTSAPYVLLQSQKKGAILQSKSVR